MRNLPTRRQLSLHYLYTIFLFGLISLIMVHLPLVLHKTGYSSKDIGFLLSVYNFTGLLAIILFGRLLDTFRCYRLLILGGLFLSAVAFSRLLFLHNWYWSLLVIIVLAVGFLPQVSLNDSYLSVRYHGLPQYYGRIRSLGSVGYVLSLALSSFLSLFNPYLPWRLQFWIFGLVGLVVLLFWVSSADSLKYISQSANRPEKNKTTSDTVSDNVRTGIKLLGWKLIILLLLLVVCWALVMGVNTNFLALFLSQELQVKYISIFFILATCSEVPIIFWGRRILYRKPLGWMLLLAFSVALLRLLLYAVLPFTPVILLSQILHSLAYGLFHISMIAIINNYFTIYRSTAIAIYSSIPTLSNSFGAILGGILIESYGFNWFFWIFLLLVCPIFIPLYLLRSRFFNL